MNLTDIFNWGSQYEVHFNNINGKKNSSICTKFTGVGIDGEVSKTMQKLMTKQGMKFKLGTKVTGVRKEGGLVKVDVEAAKGGNKETVCMP